MVPIITLMIVLALSMLVTRIATTALTLTGLSQESAEFQARSAFSGVGFTTSEAEKVVNHPVRRRILMVLMLTGNAGFVTVMASVILTFIHAGQTREWVYRALFLLLGLLLIIVLSRSQWVNRHLSKVIHWALKKWTDLDVRDYADLFKFSNGYAVSEFLVEDGDWLAGKKLSELGLTEEGVLILGITREGGEYIGAPQGSTVVQANDRVIGYGRGPRLHELDSRGPGPEGERAHRDAVADQRGVLKEQVAMESPGSEGAE